MNEVITLFPDEALAVLRRAQHDPDAIRWLDPRTYCFHWSDELLFRVYPICENQGSRAYAYVMNFRSSLIRGRPIEEYRATWDQLRAACPDWPGFRPERTSPALVRDLNWYARWARVSLSVFGIAFIALSCILWFSGIVAGTTILIGGLSHGDWIWSAIGLGIFSACVSVYELLAGWSRLTAARSPLDRRHLGEMLLTLTLFPVVLSVVAMLTQLTLMDGGVRFRAAFYSYVVYLIAAALVLTRVRRAWPGRFELFFVRWGWLPIVAVGTALCLAIWRSRGIVS